MDKNDKIESYQINTDDKTSNTLTSKKRHREEEFENDDKIFKKAATNGKNDNFNNNFKKNTDCPYLGTIKRHMLDFDFEKVCSITLSNLNVYACLVCGKYYQGRGINTQAYTHSLEEDHHMFINLQDQRIFCLPDGYEVIDNSLNDIKFNLKPHFTKGDIEHLDNNNTHVVSRALDGTEFYPGCIGLNNIKRTDYVNVIIQTLCKVSKIRNYFLQYEDNTTDLKFNLNGLFIQRWAELFRKIWNHKNFKGHVSPHEVMQAITLASNNKFKIVEQSDSINFLSWFLNTIHDYLCKKNNTNKSIISESFQGKLLIETFTRLKEDDKVGFNESIVELDEVTYKYEKKIQNFFFLTFELPKSPLFKDSSEKINIPQISIFQLLSKYNGKTFTEDPVKGIKRRYHLLKLPKNLIFYFKRFEKNMFFMEKNNTIVTFPLKNLSLKDYSGESTKGKDIKYDLTANIIHDGKPESGAFRVQVKHKALDKWFDIQDLNVNQIMAQSVVVSESYIHVYESQNGENKEIKTEIPNNLNHNTIEQKK